MSIESYKDGMKVKVNGIRGVAVALEKCNDESYVVHIAFPGKEHQWRVPIAVVEEDKR